MTEDTPKAAPKKPAEKKPETTRVDMPKGAQRSLASGIARNPKNALARSVSDMGNGTTRVDY
jgi:hypothetical protein